MISKNVFKRELITAGYDPNSEIKTKNISSLFLENKNKGMDEKENIINILSQLKMHRTEVKKILLTKGYIKKENLGKGISEEERIKQAEERNKQIYEMHLEGGGEIFPAVIAKTFGIKKPTVITIIKKMQKADGIEKLNKDGANINVNTELEGHNNPRSNPEGYVPKHKFK